MSNDTSEQHFGWSLRDYDTPLKRNAVKNYCIAQADDISGVISLGMVACAWRGVRSGDALPAQLWALGTLWNNGS